MKIVVTGASGFLGNRIAEYYSREHEVFTPTHAEMDITEKEAVKTYLESINPDAVIHCAAVSDVGECEREPERSHKINVDGSVNIAEISGLIGAKCILCSSDQVYVGSTVTCPHKEDEVLEPSNVYGRQKLLLEQKCLEKNPDSVLLRLSWMYAKESREGKEHENLMSWLPANIRQKKEMSFLVNDMRGITDAAEVAANMEKALLLPGGVYNFGSCNDKNTYETMREALRMAGVTDLSLLQGNMEGFAENPRNLTMNIEKIEKAGITFSPTAEGIAATLRKILQ